MTEKPEITYPLKRRTPRDGDLSGAGAFREANGLVLAAGCGTGLIRRVPHAAGHRGHRARQLGAPQGFRPKGATKAAAPPMALPALTPAVYGGPPLAAHHSPDWPRPSFAVHAQAVRPGAPKARP